MSQRLTELELIQRLNTAKEKVTIGAFYRHYKGGLYKVLDLAISTENDDNVCVVYQAQYGDKITFTRPVNIWTEMIHHEGKTIERFALT